jgi:hypothetical protein
MASKTQFNIIDASVIFSRVDGSEVEVDIRNNVIEFQTFEHLQKPYIDARIVFLDDFGMKDTLSVQGTERLRITIGDLDEPEQVSFTKFFFFSKINEVRKANERSEIISLELVEEHVFVNAVKQISRSFTSNIENMIETIVTNELGRSVTKYKFEGTAQGIRKVIIPYLSPLEAVNWIKDRATTRTGSPIYLHASLFSNSLRLSDLDSLLKEPSFNEKFPLRYTQAASSVDDKDDELKSYYNIISYRESNVDNMMQLYEEGAIGSYYANIDAGTGISSGAHITIRDIIDEFYTNGLISPDVAQTVYDPSLLIDGKLSDEYNSLSVFQVTSSGTYNQFKSYHDEAVLLNEYNDLIESKLKITNKIIRNILKKNVIDIGVDGRLFLESEASPGNKVRVIFLNSNTSNDEKEDASQIDKRKSGDYLILAINHRFNENKHLSSLRLTKIGELPKDYGV